MNEHQQNQVRMRLEHHFGRFDTIAACVVELRNAEYMDAINAIDAMADDPRAWKPTPARLRQAHRKVLAARKEVERAKERAQRAIRDQEQADAYWRLATRARKALAMLEEHECRAIVDAAMEQAEWVALDWGQRWVENNERRAGSARKMLEGPMIAVLIEAMLDRGAVEDYEGALERSAEELEAARESERLIRKGYDALDRRGNAKISGRSGDFTSGELDKMLA